MNYKWHFEVIPDAAPLLMKGVGYTVLISVTSAAAAGILGLVVALMRTSRFRAARAVGGAYVELFRATPALVQAVWIFYALPVLVGIAFSPLVSGILALSLNLGAFASEIYRAGMQAVPQELREASLAIGHRPRQTLARVVVPLALRRMVPPFGTLWIALFKDSSILSIIGVAELMYQGRVLAVETYRPMEVFTVVALIYFAITYPQAIVVEHLYKRFRPKD